MNVFFHRNKSRYFISFKSQDLQSLALINLMKVKGMCKRNNVPLLRYKK
jgi:hypothetical protein